MSHDNLARDLTGPRTLPLEVIRADGGTQPREEEWVALHGPALRKGAMVVGLRHEHPRAIASVIPSEVPGGFHIRVDHLNSLSETRRPVRLAFVPAQMSALGFDWEHANWSHTTPGAAHLPTGDVYFIQAEQGGPIKVGKADVPGRRLADIQRMSPVPLRVLAVLRGGGHKAERTLHRRFSDSRSHGEWFHPTPELLALIAELAS